MTYQQYNTKSSAPFSFPNISGTNNIKITVYILYYEYVFHCLQQSSYLNKMVNCLVNV